MSKPRSESDEHYLIDLCDRILGRTALRQHRFEFLVGDPSPKTKRRLVLPVDAYYPDLNLVVEVMERQHEEVAPLFDQRVTVSGVSRGEQRRVYDLRRAEILPKNGIYLIVLDVAKFPVSSRKKLLRRTEEDEIVLRKLPHGFLT